MKGYPLIRIAVVLLFMLLLLLPVCRLTLRHPAGATAEQLPDPAPAASPFHPLRATIMVHAAPAPLRCSVSEEGRILLGEKNQVSPGEYRAEADLDKGVDLAVAAGWESEDPHALRVQVLVHGYQAPLEKTFWARSTLEDTLPIPASFLP